MKSKIVITCLVLLFGPTLGAQEIPDFFKSAGSPLNPKMKILWNRYNTDAGIAKICTEITKAYPQLATVESIGKSYEGKDILVLIITNFQNKKPEDKPGFYIDGNIHSNEIQGSEIALYTAWYLTESYNNNAFIKDLLDERVFYIIPTINPDARNNYMLELNSVDSPRSGMIPVDDDRDGLIDEDGYDDLDGDGNLVMMRRKTPYGQYKSDPDNPSRMIRVENGKFGDYEILGYEGIDNDGDGDVNEDAVGYYDPNRDWSYNWQPDYLQDGALPFPFYTPENKAVRDFIIAHPNIAGAQSYHNSGGMILRDPAQEKYMETYEPEDEMVFNTIGKIGEKILPGYNLYILWKDLYPVYGGEIDWFYGARGIYMYTNELFTSQMYFGSKNISYDKEEIEMYEFDKYLLFGDAFIPWKEIDHPQYGKIEIGGFSKNFGRPEPGFLLESDAHRNMAFTLFHAYHTPLIKIDKIDVRDIGNGMQEVEVAIVNSRLTPTRSGQNRKHNIDPEDRVIIEGVNAVGKMIVRDKDLNLTDVQTGDPSVIRLENIPGMSVTRVRWVTEKGEKIRITLASAKGGKFSFYDYNP
jgi:hypothetical protein